MNPQMTVPHAAEAYRVPKSTLQDHLSGRVGFGAKSGPPKYLSDLEEEELVNFLNGSASVGFARSKKQVLAIVQNVVTKKGLNVVGGSHFNRGILISPSDVHSICHTPNTGIIYPFNRNALRLHEQQSGLQGAGPHNSPKHGDQEKAEYGC